MIVGIFGLPGSGKSMEGVRRAGLAHDRGDTHVYANTALALERFTLVTPLTLHLARVGACPCKCPKVFVLLDEAHLWLPARRSMQLPVTWLALFSQTRKMGWELYYTAQHETRVDRMLRDVTDFMVLAVAKELPERFVYHWFEKDGFRDVKFRIKKDLRRRSRRASALYETLAPVDGADHLSDPRDPYAAAMRAGAAVQGSEAVGGRTGVSGAGTPRPDLSDVLVAGADVPVEDSPRPLVTEWRF